MLVIGATLDAANELARSIVHSADSVFGWHRFSLAQLAATLAKPRTAAAGVVPIGQLSVVATVTRAIHRLSSRGALGRYTIIANGPGFPRAIANVISELRLASLGADVLVRADSGFARDELMAWCEANGVHFLFGVPMKRVSASDESFPLRLTENEPTIQQAE